MLSIQDVQAYNYEDAIFIIHRRDLKRNEIEDMLAYINNTSESGYQMYLADGNNDDIYFNNIDELLDILKLKFSDLDDRIKDISYINQYNEYRFNVNNREYHLGEL